MPEDNNSQNPPVPNPPTVYNFDDVDPLPPRVTTEGYELSDKELQQILNEQQK